MNITIEPTTQFLEKEVMLDPTLTVRVWHGKTDLGSDVIALVALIKLSEAATAEEHAAFKAALLEVDLQLVPAPGEDPAVTRAAA